MDMIAMRFPGGLGKAFTTSYDDGVQQDVRLISIMRKNGIKGTFNLNSGCFAPEGTVYPKGQVHRRMSLSECLEAYKGDDIEVAVHAYTHPFLEKLPVSECVLEIVKDRQTLEEKFGGFVRGGAYPYGTFNDNVVNVLDACGIKYCRTVISTHAFNMPKDWLRLEATCHHNDDKLNALGDEFIAKKVDRDPLMFYLWGHSYEFEGNDNWDVIEGFLAKIGGKSDIWYATNIEIYDYTRAFERLVFSCDGKRVYNPSVTEVWFEANRKLYNVPAGQTIEI